MDNLGETFALVIVEAMMSGLPVVASDWDGYRDLIDRDVTGILVPTVWCPGKTDLDALAEVRMPTGIDHARLAQTTVVDEDALLAALTRLLANPEERNRMGAAGRARALAEYTWEAVLARYEDVWRELESRAKEEEAHGPEPSAVIAYDDFRVLASRVAETTDELYLGQASAPELVAAALRLHGDTAGMIQSAVVWSLLNRVSPGVPFGEIASTRELKHHVMWMAKHGMITMRPSGGV